MLPGVDLTTLAHTIGVLGIAAIIFAESGLLVGFFLPGDTLLFTAGFLAQEHVLGINIHLLVAILFVAAVLGNSTGYMLGHRFGRRIFKKPDSLFFTHENLTRAEAFYKKYGAFTLVITRFIPVIRTISPLVAGVGNMKQGVFLLYNAIGGALWVASVTYIGYFGGAFLQARGINVEALILPVISLVMLVAIASPIYHILHDKERRAVLLRYFRKSKD